MTSSRKIISVDFTGENPPVDYSQKEFNKILAVARELGITPCRSPKER
jgi:hypothetical protein